MDGKLTELWRYDNAEVAHLDRIMLEEAGIRAVLSHENTVSTNWFYTVAAGGIQLLVHPDDLEQARRLLAEVHPITDNDAESEKSQANDGYDLLCPACDSSDVYFERSSRRFFFWALLIFRFPFPFLIKGDRARCRKCGHKWKQH